ncbi:hypothetical protein C2I06_10305 [Niallia circulans]|nr:hypothetical protein C2I06_10305 [Niallia circulans]
MKFCNRCYWRDLVSNGGGFGLAVSVLLVVMLADYVTGLLCAFVNKELNSAKGQEALKKS